MFQGVTIGVEVSGFGSQVIECLVQGAAGLDRFIFKALRFRIQC